MVHLAVLWKCYFLCGVQGMRLLHNYRHLKQCFDPLFPRQGENSPISNTCIPVLFLIRSFILHSPGSCPGILTSLSTVLNSQLVPELSHDINGFVVFRLCFKFCLSLSTAGHNSVLDQTKCLNPLRLSVGKRHCAVQPLRSPGQELQRNCKLVALMLTQRKVQSCDAKSVHFNLQTEL